MRTVLVLDDELFTRKALVRSLQQTGQELNIIEAADGTNIIQTIFEHDVDLVLLDLHMQPADGHQTAQEIRADHRYRDLPIVIISSHISSEIRIHLNDLNIQDYISKSQLSFTDQPDFLFTMLTQKYLY